MSVFDLYALYDVLLMDDEERLECIPDLLEKFDNYLDKIILIIDCNITFDKITKTKKELLNRINIILRMELFNLQHLFLLSL